MLALCAWLALPQHGGVGIPFPIATPRGRSSKFPRKGMSQVTYVTMVPESRERDTASSRRGAMLRTQASDEEVDGRIFPAPLYTVVAPVVTS